MASQGNAKRKDLTPAQWERVDALFHDALERPPSERSAWIASTCGDDPDVRTEVLSLLGSDDEAGGEFGARHLRPAFASLLKPALPERVGNYKLVREIGHGGMGTVYLAERDDDQYKSQVAIKLVRHGLDTDFILHRFYRERQTLARLQHPNIARLLDGGSTDEGLPYLVMELVDGVRITQYCRDRSLNLAQKLALFLDVCKAAGYAHRQFVVHRDLKPGNILVDKSGEIKLLDFGICKLLHSPQTGEETIDGSQGALTPDYASPEQIRGERITVASDIYSAAAVLYELLTGARPHRIDNYSIQGIERGICEADILPPSAAAADRAVSRQLQGDLDTILMCALQKEPAARYPSIDQFADDIRRHLEQRPVMARPYSLTYRAGKFLLRRRGWVASAAAILIAVTLGVASAVRSARIANENLRLVRQLSNTFVFDVYDSVRDLPGSTAARQLIVKTGLEYLDSLSRNSSGDPELQRELAAAYRRIGDVQGDVMNSNLGRTAEGLRSYRQALSLLDSVVLAAPDNRAAVVEQITLHERIGAIQSYTDSSGSQASFDRGRAIADAFLARFPQDAVVGARLASILNASAEFRRRFTDYPAARERYLQALAILEKLEKDAPSDRGLQRSLSETYSGLGLCETRLGNLPNALAFHRQAVARMERLAELDPSNVPYQRDLMFKYSHIGDLLGNPNLRNLGDRPGAVAAYGKTLAIARTLYQADPADQRARGDYGIALARIGVVLPEADSAARIATFRESISHLQEVARRNPQNAATRVETAAIHSFLGSAYLSAGDHEAAARSFRAGLALAEPQLASGSGTVISAALNQYRKLGELLAARGNREESLSLARSAVRLADAPAGKPRPPDLQRAVIPRAYAAGGFIHAALAAGPGNTPRDAADAREWLGKSLAAFRELSRLPTFSENQRREMQSVEKVLEKLR